MDKVILNKRGQWNYMSAGSGFVEGALKGLISYYSGSGNTRLACQYIASNIKNVNFELFNITRDVLPDFNKYDVAGFATFTDFLNPPYLSLQFLEKLDSQDNMPAFVFNTYGFINGKTCRTLARKARSKGFHVVAGHSLHMPESYPPMIAGGRGNEQAPDDDEELHRFIEFVRRMDCIFGMVINGEGKDVRNMGFGFWSAILPSLPRTRSRNDMGIKHVDGALCNECKICMKICPYKAIRMDPKPIFDMDKCYGCWSCYNHCPRQAIYTNKLRGGIGQYPKPIEALKNKLRF
jgi:ferredoxin/flavodoxin